MTDGSEVDQALFSDIKSELNFYWSKISDLSMQNIVPLWLGSR